MNSRKMNIQEFFKGRDILVTGGTGFMGKVLIEKLVRSCPNIGKVYMLLRHKKGKDMKARLEEFLEFELFDTVKQQNPGLIEKKLCPVSGDLSKLQLGLSDKDYNMLAQNVTVVFHVAASVRFDDSIRDATILNVRGTREVIQLAKQMKNLKVLLHVSTAYCNCTRANVDEKIYESPVGWRETIAIAENLDPEISSILTKKFLGSFPNTYTFTKLLAEQIVNEERNNIPAVIFRPSIVISTLSDPVEGWLDNFNGPIGLMIACGKGVVRITYASKSIIPDYMPVDVSIKAMLVAAWNRTLQNNSSQDNPIPVYNSASVSKSVSNEELLKIGMEALKAYPFEEMLWCPNIAITSCFFFFYIGTIFQQVLPAIFFDALLDLINKPHKRLLTLQQKIYITTTALSYFSLQSWKFENSKFLALINKIPATDRQKFDYNFEDANPANFMRKATIGSQKYLFKVDLKRLPIARKKHQRYIWLDRILKTIVLIIFVWCLLQFNIIPSTLLKM